MVDPSTRCGTTCSKTGIAAEDDLLWFRDNPCPPDIIGVNYYVTSERWLDHRPERYPQHHRGVADGIPCADIEASRALATPTPGIAPLLQEIWDRYGLPLAITEAHIDANREDQLRWLLEIWKRPRRCAPTASTCAPSRSGRCSAPSTGTAWSPNRGYYEPGPFDVRSPSRARPRWRA
jgi:dTDP-4-dehydrorhamnose reductase